MSATPSSNSLNTSSGHNLPGCRVSSIVGKYQHGHIGVTLHTLHDLAFYQFFILGWLGCGGSSSVPLPTMDSIWFAMLIPIGSKISRRLAVMGSFGSPVTSKLSTVLFPVPFKRMRPTSPSPYVEMCKPIGPQFWFL